MSSYILVSTSIHAKHNQWGNFTLTMLDSRICLLVHVISMMWYVLFFIISVRMQWCWLLLLELLDFYSIERISLCFRFKWFDAHGWWRVYARSTTWIVVSVMSPVKILFRFLSVPITLWLFYGASMFDLTVYEFKLYECMESLLAIHLQLLFLDRSYRYDFVY